MYSRQQIREFLETASALEKEGKTEHIKRMFETVKLEDSAVVIFYEELKKYPELIKYLC